MHLHLAEAPREGHLRGRRQVERREDPQLVAQQGRVLRGKGLRRQFGREVQTDHARAQPRGQRLQFEGAGHGGSIVQTAPCTLTNSAYSEWLAAMNRRLFLAPPKHRLAQRSGRWMWPMALPEGS